MITGQNRREEASLLGELGLEELLGNLPGVEENEDDEQRTRERVRGHGRKA